MSGTVDRHGPMRICFFGDSFVNGTGDDACLGWAGRACAAARHAGRDLTCYNLGIRGDTTAHVLQRWHREAEARLLPEHDGRLVFSFGANDCCPGADGAGVRVAPGQALANAEAILKAARASRLTLMVGPASVGDAATDRRIAELSAEFATLCAGLDVPYLELFSLVAASPVWSREVAQGDGAHPNKGGYEHVAEAFMRWPPWRRWIEGPA
jgi:lysophospholipase L1-like esterase